MLRNRSLAALLAAEVVSTTGSQMTWLALPWFVLLTSGSATRMSLVVAAELIGVGLGAVPGGKLIARIGARRAMMLCDAVRGPVILAIPVLYWAGSLTFAMIVAAAFVAGAFTGPSFNAQRIIVPELLGEDEGVIGRANALFQAATRTTMLLGPLCAGLLITLLSAPMVLVVDAATYAVSLALVGLFVQRGRAAAQAEPAAGARAGIRFLLRDRLLRVWIVVFAIGDSAWTAFFIAVPVLVVARFGSDARIAGWLVASFGIGALIGNAVAYRFLADRVRGISMIAAGVMGQALPLWLLTIHLPAAAYSAALVASGIANGVVNPPIHTILTLRVPKALRPGALAAMTAVFTLIGPVGVFIAGPVLEAFGPQPVLVALAVVQTLTMGTIALTALRERAELDALESEAVISETDVSEMDASYAAR
jgi:MFS family permease